MVFSHFLKNQSEVYKSLKGIHNKNGLLSYLVGLTPVAVSVESEKVASD